MVKLKVDSALEKTLEKISATWSRDALIIVCSFAVLSVFFGCTVVSLFAGTTGFAVVTTVCFLLAFSIPEKIIIDV